MTYIYWRHRLARLEHLMERRPLLLSSVVLRQNPHNVHEWHKRAKLFKDNPTKKILAYTEAVKTVDPEKVCRGGCVDSQGGLVMMTTMMVMMIWHTHVANKCGWCAITISSLHSGYPLVFMSTLVLLR